jgi:hypothetical protein
MKRLLWLTVVAAVLVASSCSRAAATPTSTAMLGAEPTGTTEHPGDATFPSEIAGLPVISVADAVALVQAGKLDGRAVAVAGYYDEFAPSCPYPGRYIGPLENWCRLVAFTDSRGSAQLCEPMGANGVRCSQPSGTSMPPFFVSETSGSAWSSLTGGMAGKPAAVVLVGHAGDARQWQCTAATQAECAKAFVVDRIAWAEGRDIPLAAPEIGSLQTGKTITPRMTLAQVTAGIGAGDDLLTAAALRAGDVATVDPRWNFAGDRVVWLARTLAAADGSGQTRSETVWLVDDTTGHVVDSHPLQVAADDQPARLWQMATVHGVDCCSGTVLAFYRVESGDGTVVFEGMVPGDATGGQDSTTYGGGYHSSPLVLPAGAYTVAAWLAPYDRGATGAPRDECSTQVTLRPLGDVALNADFPAGKACAFQPAPSSSSGP